MNMVATPERESRQGGAHPRRTNSCAALPADASWLKRASLSYVCESFFASNGTAHFAFVAGANFYFIERI